MTRLVLDTIIKETDVHGGFGTILGAVEDVQAGALVQRKSRELSDLRGPFKWPSHPTAA